MEIVLSDVKEIIEALELANLIKVFSFREMIICSHDYPANYK
jgi:hypothetical protein